MDFLNLIFALIASECWLFLTRSFCMNGEMFSLLKYILDRTFSSYKVEYNVRVLTLRYVMNSLKAVIKINDMPSFVHYNWKTVHRYHRKMYRFNSTKGFWNILWRVNSKSVRCSRFDTLVKKNKIYFLVVNGFKMDFCES